MIKNIVLAGLVNEEKILLLRRANPPYKGYWGMPAGKIKLGEHVETAAQREAREETGFETRFKGVKGIVSETLSNNDELKGHFMLFVCELEPLNEGRRIEGRTAGASPEGELAWFSLNDLSRQKLIPSDLLMIKKFFLEKKSDLIVHRVRMIERDNEYFIESTSLR